MAQQVDLDVPNGPGAATRSTASDTRPAANLDQVAEVGGRIGRRDLAGRARQARGRPAGVIAMLAEGHLLIEDVPGTGKTVLAKALARTVDSTVSRVQFTPDLMPSDVTGVSVYDRQSSQFEFRPGPMFANIVVADEINRASPEDPVGAAGVHGGTAGHRRRHQLPAGPAVPGAGHPEPGRDGGHLPAARGAARPVPGPAVHRLPGPRGRGRHAGRPGPGRPARRAARR